MALPQDGQDANGLTKVTQIPAGKELMFIDPTTNEGGIITLEDLTKQILNGLTSQAFGLDSGTQTLPAAINYLYGNSLRKLDIEDDTAETMGKPVETLKNNIEKFQSSSDVVYFGFIQCGTRAQYIGFTILENQYASFLIHSYGTDLVQLKRINGKWE